MKMGRSKRFWVIMALSIISLYGLWISVGAAYWDDYVPELAILSVLTVAMWIYAIIFFAGNAKRKKLQKYGLSGILVFYGIFYLCGFWGPLSRIVASGFYGILKFISVTLDNPFFTSMSAYGIMFLILGAINIIACLKAQKKESAVQ